MGIHILRRTHNPGERTGSNENGDETPPGLPFPIANVPSADGHNGSAGTHGNTPDGSHDKPSTLEDLINAVNTMADDALVKLIVRSLKSRPWLADAVLDDSTEREMPASRLGKSDSPG